MCCSFTDSVRPVQCGGRSPARSRHRDTRPLRPTFVGTVIAPIRTATASMPTPGMYSKRARDHGVSLSAIRSAVPWPFGPLPWTRDSPLPTCSSIRLSPSTRSRRRRSVPSIVADVADPSSVDVLLAEHPHWRREDAERKRASLLGTSVEVIHRTFTDNRDWSLGEQLASIAAPVHILGAGEDPLYTAEDFALHQTNATALTFEQVPETGHSIHRDDPATVIDRALDLLSHGD